jgi:large-conductance mechanosensitive channel
MLVIFAFTFIKPTILANENTTKQDTELITTTLTPLYTDSSSTYKNDAATHPLVSINRQHDSSTVTTSQTIAAITKSMKTNNNAISEDNIGNVVYKLTVDNQTTIVINVNTTTLVEKALNHLLNEGKFIQNIWLYTSGITTFFVLIFVVCIQKLSKKCQNKKRRVEDAESKLDEDGMSEIQDLLNNNMWNMKIIKKVTTPPYNATVHRRIETDIE